ncbi:unnamed protein product [Sphenostylis stenocarpa]|uniref:Uncharacterized protein n=1 Tax=Sphenostylis stenocarpa TaxID=92480 RepID=A0AA86V245_9FABA|nr:unnamed protein product [Sphenostylis stenocarpa]
MVMQREQTLPTHINSTFLNSNSNQSNQHQSQENNSNDVETPLDDILARLEALLTLLGFNQSSLLSFTVSWTAFVAVGVAAPLVALQVYDTDKNQIKGFEIGIVAFQSCLAAMSVPKFDVEKFDGSNDFSLWKLKLQALLDQQGLTKALEDIDKLS